MPDRHTERAFETVIEAHLLANGYVRVASDGFDRERAIFPETVLGFIQETQPTEWAKLHALHGERTGDQVLGDLCKWMDQYVGWGEERTPTFPTTDRWGSFVTPTYGPALIAAAVTGQLPIPHSSASTNPGPEDRPC